MDNTNIPKDVINIICTYNMPDLCVLKYRYTNNISIIKDIMNELRMSPWDYYFNPLLPSSFIRMYRIKKWARS